MNAAQEEIAVGSSRTPLPWAESFPILPVMKRPRVPRRFVHPWCKGVSVLLCSEAVPLFVQPPLSREIHQASCLI